MEGYSYVRPYEDGTERYMVLDCGGRRVADIMLHCIRTCHITLLDTRKVGNDVCIKGMYNNGLLVRVDAVLRWSSYASCDSMARMHTQAYTN